MQLDVDCQMQQCDAPVLDAFIAQNGDASVDPARPNAWTALNLSKNKFEDSSADESIAG